MAPDPNIGRVQVRFDELTYEDIRHKAYVEYITPSQVVKNIVEEYFAEKSIQELEANKDSTKGFEQLAAIRQQVRDEMGLQEGDILDLSQAAKKQS